MLQLEVIGNLGADATIREFNGQKFIAFSVAHTESYNDQQGQRHERTTWVSCLKFGESAVINYLKKGTRVFVRGDLSVKAYQDNAHNWQVGVNCLAREVQLLPGGKRDQNAGTQQEAPAEPATNTNVSSAPAASETGEGNADDLPF